MEVICCYLDKENYKVLKFNVINSSYFEIGQSAFTFSKLTIETLEQGVKYVQS